MARYWSFKQRIECTSLTSRQASEFRRPKPMATEQITMIAKWYMTSKTTYSTASSIQRLTLSLRHSLWLTSRRVELAQVSPKSTCKSVFRLSKQLFTVKKLSHLWDSSPSNSTWSRELWGTWLLQSSSNSQELKNLAISIRSIRECSFWCRFSRHAKISTLS